MPEHCTIGTVTRILLDYEIEACEKRLEHFKEHGSVLDRWFGTTELTRAAYEADLNWLYRKRDAYGVKADDA